MSSVCALFARNDDTSNCSAGTFSNQNNISGCYFIKFSTPKSANSSDVELAIKPTELLVETASERSAVRSARSGAVNSSRELICRIEISEVFGDISSF